MNKERREVEIRKSERTVQLNNLMKKMSKDGGKMPFRVRTCERYIQQIDDLQPRNDDADERYQKIVQMKKEAKKTQHKYEEMEKDIEEEFPFIRALKVGTNDEEQKYALGAALNNVHREYIDASNKYCDEIELVTKERSEVRTKKSEILDIWCNLKKDVGMTPSELQLRTCDVLYEKLKDLEQRDEDAEEKYKKTIQMNKEADEKKQKYKEIEKELKDLEKTIQTNEEVNKKRQKYKEIKKEKRKEHAKYLAPLVQQPTENV